MDFFESQFENPEWDFVWAKSKKNPGFFSIFEEIHLKSENITFAKDSVDLYQ